VSLFCPTGVIVCRRLPVEGCSMHLQDPTDFPVRPQITWMHVPHAISPRNFVRPILRALIKGLAGTNVHVLNLEDNNVSTLLTDTDTSSTLTDTAAALS